MNPNLIRGPLKIVERVELFRSQYKPGRHTHLFKKDLSNILLQILKAYNADPWLTLINLRPRPKPLSNRACDHRMTSLRLRLYAASVTIATTFLLLIWSLTSHQ